MPELVMRGFDGSNPLGLFAALGTFAAIHPRPATLRWQWEGVWRPVLDCDVADMATLVAALNEDCRACSADPALTLEYSGKRDLKPPPDVFRDYLESLVDKSGPDARRSVDWAASFASGIATDNNGNTKPTALHFTAGNQQFLQMVSEIAEGLTAADFREAVEGPWTYSRPLPVMGWDATASRDYALRARNPSTDKKLGVPGADWLAVRGLSFFPALPVGSRIVTTGCVGGWKSGKFRWPLWTVALGRDVIRSLLAQDVDELTPLHRISLGLGAVCSSGIKRSDQGGYGSFEPASLQWS